MNATEFREDHPELNMSARIRGIFTSLRKGVKKSIPRFLDQQSHKEISRLLKETRSHGSGLNEFEQKKWPLRKTLINPDQKGFCDIFGRIYFPHSFFRAKAWTAKFCVRRRFRSHGKNAGGASVGYQWEDCLTRNRRLHGETRTKVLQQK